MQEKIITCIKCKKEKKGTEGSFIFEGSTYCCGECCKKDDDKKGKKKNVCEFC